MFSNQENCQEIESNKKEVKIGTQGWKSTVGGEEEQKNWNISSNTWNYIEEEEKEVGVKPRGIL